MNKIKVNDIVSAYSRAIGLDDGTKGILLELMENIITKYEKIIPYVSVQEDPTSVYFIKPVNGRYSVEDFFLNRLMRNVMSVNAITQKDIDEGLADIHTKGQFSPDFRTVYLNFPKTQNQLERYKNLFGDGYEKAKKISFKKTVMHEFMHGLQTTYENCLDINEKGNYKRISDELKKLGKYSQSIRTFEEINADKKLTRSLYISTGVHYSSIAKPGCKTYRDVDGSINFNEILNESESLEMAGKNYSILSHNNEKGVYIRNFESSNSLITNYGDLFKELIGGQNTFSMMYINPRVGFEVFNDRYNDIFQKEYGSKEDAITLFIKAITSIKNKRELEEQERFDKTLALCFERKVNKYFNRPDVTNEQMMNSLDKFFQLTIKPLKSNVKLEHVEILNRLKTKISNRGINQVNKNNHANMVLPSFQELANIVRNYSFGNDINNIEIVNRKTKEKVRDSILMSKAFFANIWLMSAGFHMDGMNEFSKIDYAFNEENEKIYNFILNSIKNDIMNKGYIDTVSLFKNIELISKNAQEIVVNLFRSEYQCDTILKFFQKYFPSAPNQNIKMQPLYNLAAAGNLAYGDDEKDTIVRN